MFNVTQHTFKPQMIAISTGDKFRTHQGADPLYEETSTAYGLQNTQ